MNLHEINVVLFLNFRAKNDNADMVSNSYDIWKKRIWLFAKIDMINGILHER